MSTAEIIVIGSGIGGLCCAALLAHYGFDVLVCESHALPGGAAHAFQRQGYCFDSGPSLYSGLSYSPSSNPLRQVLDAIGEDLDWVNYDAWGCCLPEGNFSAKIGADAFCEILANLRGKEAVQQWRSLQRVMQPLGEAAIAIPTAAFRANPGVVFSLGRYAPAFLQYARYAKQLTGPFSEIVQPLVRDRFILNWLDLLSFLLSGLPASGTIGAEMAFMFAEWYRPQVQLDYPKGGSGAIVAALCRGITKQGGSIRYNSHVETLLVEGQRAVGVQLRGGEQLRARRAVISNASIWDTLRLIPPEAISPRFRQRRQATPVSPSFMHLHLGIDAANLPPHLDCHYIVVNDWDRGVSAEQNVVAISIPSLLDPTLAPPGKHNIHVYTPATEPYEPWQGLERPVYDRLKEQRSQVMWQALERIIPDIRQRCEVTLVGTPLTHARFLRRHRGSYGPAIAAGQGTFPGPAMPLPGLYCCGDSNFPGIGVPAVAASGMIAAHTLTPLHKHLHLLRQLNRVA
ncbi:phytoene desaturase family protein [Lyngbya confervoides]|uniref:NAD(P)/FAD-dependent oxidoreductase n=1 Tax=Lyngbya confervoides BDU141951 TaxID=1574623 RepID=A0ABD4SY59_9CYAN|nr:NAD(P)/FAD-dependent oxidoreductase [Lyngbya confervoides]MCM1981278.1 NAD(P)/FAD-dependent oxidoreductase [Lyngbya confervoides BDU141951]